MWRLTPEPVIAGSSRAQLCGYLPDQIQRRIEEDPHDIHEVPVHSRSFNAPVALGGIEAPRAITPHDPEEDQPGHHMQRVHAGHHEEDGAPGAGRRRNALGDRRRPFHAQNAADKRQAQAPG